MRKRSLKEKGITLIALIVTIIILLILAGVVIATTMNSNGLINKTNKTASLSRYESAKEKLQLKLWEIMVDCEAENKPYTIYEIEQQLYDDENFIIVAYYKKTAAKRSSVTRNTEDLIGVGVVVKNEEDYSFLIGEKETGNEPEIIGVAKVEKTEDESGDNATELAESDYKPENEFKEEEFNIVSEPPSTNTKVEPLYIFNNGTVPGYTWTTGTYSIATEQYVNVNSNNISYSQTYNSFIYCNQKINNIYKNCKIRLTFNADGRDWSKINVYIRPSTSYNEDTHFLASDEYVYRYLTNSDNENYVTSKVFTIPLNEVPTTVEDYYLYIHTAGATWTITQIWFE